MSNIILAKKALQNCYGFHIKLLGLRKKIYCTKSKTQSIYVETFLGFIQALDY